MFNELKFDWQTLQWAVVTAIGIYSWFVGRHSASSKEMLEMRIRLTTIEEKIHSMPTQREVAKMMSHLSRMESSLASVTKQLDTVGRQIDNVNDYLLNNK